MSSGGLVSLGPAPPGVVGRRRRRPSLTPMIDVVFLLLVFFMLAARFGAEAGLRIDLAAGGAAPTLAGAEWDGPPRLIDVLPDGQRLNGVALDLDGLLAALPGLMPAEDAPVILRPRDGATLQRIVALAGALSEAGISRLVVLP